MISTLTTNRRRLVRTMLLIGRGRVEHLVIRNGEPMFHLRPRISAVSRIGILCCPWPDDDLEDSLLSDEFVALFQLMEEIQHGIISLIQVEHGLPKIIERPQRIGFDS